MNRFIRLFICCAIVLMLLPSFSAGAITLPPGFSETVLTNELGDVTSMSIAPDGRVFVSIKTGAIRVLKNDALLPTPFITLTVNSEGERGALGIAFDPNFAANHYLYIYYTVATAPVHNRLSRFTANGDVVLAGSEVPVLDLDPLVAINHNGGAVHFGPDGKLYISVGENSETTSAQSLESRLGKILRINSDGTIPTDNPFYGTATGANRMIWALGLRNPYTFAFQRGTGRMFINDVGQAAWEEINDGIAGSNYGWPVTEGYTTNPSFRSPLLAYSHTPAVGQIDGCAITAGDFYNPTVEQFPSSYVGKYFFADYCNYWIYYVDPNGSVPFTPTQFALTTNGGPVAMQISNDGSLYYLGRNLGGSVNKITYSSAPQAPSIAQQPVSITRTVGQDATFSCLANGSLPITYKWQRNTVDISGANSSSYTLGNVQLSDSGAQFRCVATNSISSATSNSATLTVQAGQAPVAVITLPVVDAKYSGGEVISYSGTGTDNEDGTLPASAFTWEVVFHHDVHTHPFIEPFSGVKSGTFTIPTLGETSANVWYRIRLTVRDSSGLTNTVERDIHPRTSVITLQSEPAGLQLTLDGQPTNAGSAITSVVGIKRVLGVVSPQTVGGVTYLFHHWLQGGGVTQTISTPASNTTYTAVFHVSSSSVETVGVFRPTGTVFHLRNTNTTGPADLSITFGASGDIPIVGDWNGDGIDTPGVFRPSGGVFLLSDSTSNPATLTYAFVFGTPADTPIVGDWDGDGKDSVGVFRPSNGQVYLRNSLTTGIADRTMVLGIPGDIGIAGDWDGNGIDSPGVYRPSTRQFFLSNQVCTCNVFADYTMTFGITGDSPFVGDWNADGRTGVGVYRNTNSTLYLRNDPTTSGFADISAVFGIGGDKPLAGHWVSSTLPVSGSIEAAPTFVPGAAPTHHH